MIGFTWNVSLDHLQVFYVGPLTDHCRSAMTITVSIVLDRMPNGAKAITMRYMLHVCSIILLFNLIYLIKYINLKLIYIILYIYFNMISSHPTQS